MKTVFACAILGAVMGIDIKKEQDLVGLRDIQEGEPIEFSPEDEEEVALLENDSMDKPVGCGFYGGFLGGFNGPFWGGCHRPFYGGYHRPFCGGCCRPHCGCCRYGIW